MTIAKTCCCTLAVTLCVAAASSAYGRSLIHYFDFDTPSGTGLAYTGVDKGTIPANFTLKGSSVPRTTGALGSTYAYYSSAANTAIWLGDGSNSLGCGTTNGFTISFWLKTSKSHTAWTDFFGFRVGGLDYRCEYTTGNTSAFTVYYNTAKDATCPFVGISGSSSTTAAPAGVWKHAAFVFTPNSTNRSATCAFYIGGDKIAYINLNRTGYLQQIHVGTWVRGLNGDDRKSKTANNTGIDELAVFDYPVTAEQVKWLAKFKPAQPANGPGRAMPICWLLDIAVDTSGNGIQATNSGTGPWNAYKWTAGYANWPSYGALGSANSFHLNNKITFRVDSSEADGFGATLGSGLTYSFWVRAPGTMSSLWRDFTSFRIGNRYERFEWSASNPVKFTLYGTGNAGAGSFALTANTWQHVCMVWNAASSCFDFYLDGTKQPPSWSPSSPNPSEALKSLTVGTDVFNESGGKRSQGYIANVCMDEVAIFNYSCSPAQIQWLASNVPCLPPLDATNLVRTVSANGTWAGGVASWGVREWDATNEAWANTTRTTIYPTLEDTEVDVAVTLADGVELTNDTFVTPKKLALSAATSAALPLSATLKAAADSRFAPQALEIGDGLQLTVPLYAVNVGGALTFGTDSKIILDVSNYYDGGTTNALTVGSFVLPAGESDVLAHFATTNPLYTLSLSGDGKTVVVTAATIPVTATWTGEGDGSSLDSAANWDCRNSSGIRLNDALPCDRTRVYVCSGSAAMNAPVGTVVPWSYFSIEAANATLSDDVDWRGLAFPIPKGVTVNLNGHTLRMASFDGEGTITDTTTGGELHVDVASDETVENSSVAFAGQMKLVKDGAGTFVAAKGGQTYVGGSVVSNGTVRLGVNSYPVGPKDSLVTVCAGATFDHAVFSTSTCIYSYDLAGTLHAQSGAGANGYSDSYRILGSSFTLSGNATITGKWFYFGKPDKTTLALAMNGHTLTFALDDYIGFGEITVAEGDHGKMVLSSGIVEWIRGGGSATGLDVEVTGDAAFKLGTGGNASFHDLTYSSTYWQKNQVAAYLAIYGTYVAGDVRPPLMMQDGSAIDLSAIDGVFDTSGTSVTHVAAIGTGIAGQVAFVDKASIALDMGDRALVAGDCLLSWEAGTYPNAAFQFTLYTNGVAVADKSLVIKDNESEHGVYVKDAREPAYAKWVNGEWKYFSDRTHEYDGEWTQGITDTMQVLFSSVEEHNLICTTNFSPAPAAFVLTGFTGARNVTTDLTQFPFLFDEGAVLDVNGGHVKLPGSMAGSTTAFTVTNSAEQTGTLEVVVAEGTATNTKMALAGNLKFVKSGAGTFVSTLAQTYTGGTLVAEGTAQEPANSVTYSGEGDFTVYGTGTVTVESNATFTVQSSHTFTNDIVLAGGRLYGNLSGDVAMLTAVTADSQIMLLNGGDVNLHIGASGSHLDLDGHTLTFSGGTGSQYYYIDASLAGETGRFVFDSTVEYVGKLPADGNGVDIEINVRAHMFEPASVHDYKIAGSQTQWGTGTAYGLNVYGTFTPISTTFYGCTMMNGSTIDLSGKTGAWSIQSSIANAANSYGLTAAQQTARKTVSFADNATVKIKLGERKVKTGDKIVDWTGKTPANLGTLRFTSAEGEHFGLQKKDDGLYITRGIIILVR